LFGSSTIQLFSLSSKCRKYHFRVRFDERVADPIIQAIPLPFVDPREYERDADCVLGSLKEIPR
jgi:hypothetical protein